MSKRKLHHVFATLLLFITVSGIASGPSNSSSAEIQTEPISVVSETVPITG
jgi:hypothetical protein